MMSGGGPDIGIVCSGCGRANPADARFCNACGDALAAATPTPAAYTPGHLAEKIVAGGAAHEGEHKQVTVLFADVAGSMDLAEALDPERWHEVMDQFFQRLCEGIHAYEGTVSKFTGDGAMALFGAPIAHEDHARRACYAALDLSRDLAVWADQLRGDGIELAVRVGLNSGEVVLGSVGADLAVDYTAVGHTVGLAQRMESMALPGLPYVTEHTEKLVRDWFELDDLGPTEVKGSSRPLGVFALRRARAGRTALDVVGERSLSSFVGREAEIARLRGGFAAAGEGRGNVIGVRGVAGVGKSRLVRELVDERHAEGTYVNAVGALAHGRRVPLLPVLALFRDFFGVAEGDSPELARTRIDSVIGGLGLSPAEDGPVLHELLGVADCEAGAEGGEQRLREIVARITHADGQLRESVIVIEDLHWLDDSSAALLEVLAASIAGTRSLLVLTFRPEYDVSTVAAVSDYAEIALEPLQAAASGDLLREALGEDRSLDGLPELVLAHTSGNPFFIEEVVRSLAESGRLQGEPGAYRLAQPLGELTLPETIHSVLDARIDRLEPKHKRLLQAMSVIGREVPGPVLRELVELGPDELAAGLQGLERGGFIVTDSGAAGDLHFEHPLTQEVAYSSQLGERRSRVHASVAEAIERAYPDGLEERAALLALHWSAAGETARASHWHAEAAGWMTLSAPADSMRHWREVRSLAATVEDPDESERMAASARNGILSLVWRTGISEEEITSINAELHGPVTGSVPPEVETTEQRALGIFGRAAEVGTRGNVSEGLALMKEGITLVESQSPPDPGLLVNLTAGACWLTFVTGELHQGLELAERALAATGGDTAAGAGLVLGDAYALCLASRGLLAGARGDMAGGLEYIDRAQALAVEHTDQVTTNFIGHFRDELLWRQMDYPALKKSATEALDAARSGHDSLELALSRSYLAAAHVGRGRWEQAERVATEALAGIDEIDAARWQEPFAQISRAEALLGLDRGAEARSAGRLALDLCLQRDQRTLEPAARLTLARIERQHGELESAAAELRRASASMEETGQGSLQRHLEVERNALASLGHIVELGSSSRMAGFSAGRDSTPEDEPTADDASQREQVMASFARGAKLASEGQVLEAVELALTTATQLEAPGADPGLLVNVAAGALWLMNLTGHLREGEELADRALARAAGDIRVGAGQFFGACPYALCLAGRALMRGSRGRMRVALAELDRAVEIATDEGDELAPMLIRHYRESLQWRLRDYEGLRRSAQRGLELAAGTDDPQEESRARVYLALGEAGVGDHESAYENATRVCAMLDELGSTVGIEPFALLAASGAALGLGLVDESLSSARRAVEVTSGGGLRTLEVPARLALSRALRASGEVAGASAELERAQELIAATDGRGFEGHLDYERAAAADDQSGDPDRELTESILAELVPAMAAFSTGSEIDAVETMERLLDRCLSSGRSMPPAVVTTLLPWGGFVTGNLERGEDQAARALGAEDRPLNADEGVIAAAGDYRGRTRAAAALCRGAGGDLSGGRAELAETYTALRAGSDREGELYGIWHRSALGWVVGDYETPDEMIERMGELADELGGSTTAILYELCASNADRCRARFAESRARLKRVEEVVHGHGLRLDLEPYSLIMLAETELEDPEGDAQAALTAIERAIEIASERGLRIFELRAQPVLARALASLEAADADQRRARALARARELIEETGAHGVEALVDREANASSLGDPDQALVGVLTEFTEGLVAFASGREREGVPLMERAFRTAEQTDGLVSPAVVGGLLGWAHFVTGSPLTALEVSEAAVARPARTEPTDPTLRGAIGDAVGRCAAGAGLYEGALGEVDRGQARLERAIERLRSSGDREAEFYALGHQCVLWWLAGRQAEIATILPRANELFDSFGGPLFSVMQALVGAVGAHGQQRYLDAHNQAARALGVIREEGVVPYNEPCVLVVLAEAEIELGNGQEGLDAVEQAVAIAAQRGLGTWELRALPVLAQALRLSEADDAERRAEAALERGHELLGRTGAGAVAPLLSAARQSTSAGSA